VRAARRRAIVVAVLGAAALLLAAAPAWAHAGLVSSTPASGATLAKAPTEVVMNFSEQPDLSLSVVHVLNTAGSNVEAGPVKVGANPKQLISPLPANLADGSYTVSWRVVSAEDGHLTAGVFAFGIGVAPTAPVTTAATPATPSPSTLSVIAKTLLYAGLSLAVGAVATALLAFGGHVPSRRVILPAAGVMTLLGAILMTVAERSTIAVGLSTLLRSRAGHAYIWLMIGAAATFVASLVAAFRPTTRWLIVLAVAAMATMEARVQGGHASAEGVRWIQIFVQWVHFVAVGVWVGGFVPVILRLRDRRGSEDDALTTEIRRYSTIAGFAVLAVVVTGVIRAISATGGVDDVLHLFRTSYGTVLALKVVLALLLIGLGAVNRYRSIPRLRAGDPSLLRHVMGAEVVTAVILFGLTGTLTGLPPNPPPAQVTPGPTAVTATGSDFATTMKLTLTATPGTPGPNTFALKVSDFDTGAPLSGVTASSLTFTMPGRSDIGSSTLDLKRATDGTWTGSGTNLSLAGTWRVDALVQQGAHSSTVTMSLSTASVPVQVTSSSPIPGQPTIYTMTLADGRQMQVYNDPGTAGANQLHVTAFDAEGKELPLRSVAITITPEGGAPRTLDTTRFSAGHFVASETLTEGPWHFDIQATARDGSVLPGAFDQTIAAA
jgi:copper transport protein